MAQDLPEVADLIGDDVTEGDFKTAITKMLLFMRGGGGMPSGGIIMWSGSASDVPDGWALCDGNNGTPDLRDRFIVGAGGEYAAGTSGGSTVTSANGETLTSEWSGNTGNTTLSLSQMPVHSHGITAVNDRDSGTTRISVGRNTSTLNESTNNAGSGQGHAHGIPKHSHSIGNHSHSCTPPYYALCFIMKV